MYRTRRAGGRLTPKLDDFSRRRADLRLGKRDDLTKQIVKRGVLRGFRRFPQKVPHFLDHFLGVPHRLFHHLDRGDEIVLACESFNQ